jgi:pimeloyl-ACP methyl ester carboxylesterase
VGSCGGAITALLASERDPRIGGLGLIDVPVNLRAANMSFADKVAEGGDKAERLFQEYLKKAFRLSAWRRFVTLRTDYVSLLKILRMKLRRVFARVLHRRVLSADIERLCREGKLNRRFFECFERFAGKGGPILFVLAANDPGTEIFQQYFQHGYLGMGGTGNRAPASVEIVEIPNANHVYSLPECREALIAKVKTFVSHAEDQLKGRG